MAFPAIASITTTASANSSGASNDLTSTATVNSGDLLIAIIGRRIVSATTWTPPTGWTEIVDVLPPTSNDATLSVAYKIADGTEGGTTITFTSSVTTSIRKGGFVIRITGWHGTTPPEAGTSGVTVGTGDPDPPSLTASWGSADNLWIVASSATSQDSAGTAPTNYTNFNTAGEAGATKWGINMATRENAVATEDPGVIDWTTNPGGRVACTIAVRPSVPKSMPLFRRPPRFISARF